MITTKGTGYGGGVPRFGYAKADRRVTAHYFYLVGEAFGSAFVKVCAYFPCPIKIWLNGHEYAKRNARAAGIGFTELDNGFANTEDPAALQRICDTATSGVIRVFCGRWWSWLPLPLTEADRAAGYWWDISMRQVEVSRTIVFDALRAARGFYEHCAPTTSDIGRPQEMRVIFGRRVRTPPLGGYRIRLLSHLKCGRAFRIETVATTPVTRAAAWAGASGGTVGQARDVNRRMVDAFRVGQGCVLASPAFQRVARPSLEDGQSAPALRLATLGSWPRRRPVRRRAPSPGSPTGALAPR